MKIFLRTITAAIAIAAVTLSSCMKTEEIVPEVTSSDAISFGTFVDQTTKGTIYHTSDMQESGFGLMGYYNRQNLWADAAPEMIMYNQLVEYSESISAWTYSPVKYWSNIVGDYYSFFAYAPYSTSAIANGNIALSSNTYADVPVVSFTVDADPLKMVDFVAGQESDITQTEDVVRFDLKHQLTRVSLSAKTDITTDASKNTDATYVVVKSMDIVATDNFYQSGDYTFDLDNSTVLHDDHDQDGVWSNLVAFSSAYDFSTLLAVTNTAIGNYVSVSGSSIANLSYTTVDGYTETGVRVANTDAEATSLFTSGEYLFLLPPNGQEGLAADGDVIITVSYDIVTADSALAAGYSVYATKTATVALPAASLKQGRAYDILLTFDLTEIKVAGNVILWDESEIDDYGATTGYGDDAVSTIKLTFDETVATITDGVETSFSATLYDATGTSTSTAVSYYVSTTTSLEGATALVGGVFAPTAVGTYYIIAVSEYEGTTYTTYQKVEVVEIEYEIKVDETFAVLVGKSVGIGYELNPSGELTFAIVSGGDYITLNGSEVTGVSAGTAKVSISDKYGNVLDVVEVTVSDYAAPTVTIGEGEDAYTIVSGATVKVEQNGSFVFSYDTDGVEGYTVEDDGAAIASLDGTTVTVSGTTDDKGTVTILDPNGKEVFVINVLVIEKPIPATEVVLTVTDGISTSESGVYTGVFFTPAEQVTFLTTEKDVVFQLSLGETTENLSDYKWSFEALDSTVLHNGYVESSYEYDEETGVLTVTVNGFVNMPTYTTTVTATATQDDKVLTATYTVNVYAEIGFNAGVDGETEEDDPLFDIDDVPDAPEEEEGDPLN